MSLLTKINRLKPILNVPQAFSNQVKCVSYHYPDWKPGPYPKTKEEREAAAKKYGLLPEEYEPYPDDGSGWGDYPNVPIVSDDAKDFNIPWHTKGLVVRNWHDPVPVEYLGYTQDRKSTKRPPYGVYVPNPYVGILGTIAMVLVYGFFIEFIFGPTFRYHSMAPKQWPHKGEKHYAFEVIED